MYSLPVTKVEGMKLVCVLLCIQYVLTYQHMCQHRTCPLAPIVSLRRNAKVGVIILISDRVTTARTKPQVPFTYALLPLKDKHTY